MALNLHKNISPHFLLISLPSLQNQVGSEGRAAMWRQINLHTLPVLTRCLEDVVATREVSPDTLDAVGLVSKVCSACFQKMYFEDV